MSDHPPDEPWMQEAIAEARLAEAKGEVPVGAVIVHEGQIIGRGHNERESSQDPTAHAEVTCIRKACGKLGTFDLSGCTIYSSCEPCPSKSARRTGMSLSWPRRRFGKR